MAIDIKDLGLELLKLVKAASKSTVMREIAKKGKELITKRTTSGYDKNNSKLPELESSTIEIRRRRKLALTTSPSKSNVTQSGAMLKSIRATGKAKEAVVEFKNTKSIAKVGYLKSGVGKKNKSFDFFGLTSSESKQLINKIESAVGKAVDKFNQK